MEKNIKELIELNGTLSIGMSQDTIIIRVYQVTSHKKYIPDELGTIECETMPFADGSISITLQSDIISFSSDTTTIRSMKEYYIKETYVWLLDKALPYLAKVSKEQSSEIIVNSTFDAIRGRFEAYASLDDDLPVLLVSIEQKNN